MSKAKYEQGSNLWDDIMYALLNKEPIYYQHKVYTYGWYQNWPVKFIISNLRNFKVARKIL